MNLLGTLTTGLTSVARNTRAALEGQADRRDEEQKTLMAQLAMDERKAERERRSLMDELTRRNIESQIAERSAPPVAPPEQFTGQPFEAVGPDGQPGLFIRGTHGTIKAAEGLRPIQKPTAPTGPVRGTPEYLRMLEGEAKARAAGGTGNAGAVLPGPAIEKMNALDQTILLARNTSKALGNAVAKGKDVSGRVGKVIPVATWMRNAARQGGAEGVETRALLGDLFSQVANLRSGAAVSEPEMRRLEAFLPSDNDDEADIAIKLRRFVQTLEDIKRIRLENYQKYGKGGTGTAEPTASPDDIDAAIDAVLGRQP